MRRSKRRWRASGWSLAPDDDAAEMYLWSLERLDAAGYRQDEISNVARPGRESRHNLKYWTDGEWLGFGCGAHSTSAGSRWKNVASAEDYIRRIGDGVSAVLDDRRLTSDGASRGRAFTGLRLAGGLDLEAIGRRMVSTCGPRFGPDSPRSWRAACSCARARAPPDARRHAGC